MIKTVSLIIRRVRTAVAKAMSSLEKYTIALHRREENKLAKSCSDKASHKFIKTYTKIDETYIIKFMMVANISLIIFHYNIYIKTITLQMRQFKDKQQPLLFLIQ